MAQDDATALTGLSLEQLGNIEVTIASKEPEQIRRTPSAVSVIRQEDIRRSGATSLPEILRLAPGVSVARIDSDHWSVGIRGFGDQFSKSVLVLIDGRSVYTPLFAGIYWAAQDTLLDDIERIEVVRGPGGTVWGANAVNGVINIITKHSKDTSGLLASIGGGTVDHAIGSIRFGGGNGPFTYRVHAKGFTRGPEFHTNTLEPEFDDWRMAEAGFRADWQTRRDDVTVSGDLYRGRNGQSVSLAQFAPPSQAISYDPFDATGGNLLAHWRRGLAGGGNVQVQAYYDRTHLAGPQLGETRNTFDVDFLHSPGQRGRHGLLWGIGARVSPSDVEQTIPTLDVLPHAQTDSVYSAFAQDEIRLVANALWLTVGAKFERNNYTGVEAQPSARLLWTPSTRQSVWTAVTRAVRTPSRLETGFRLSGLLAATPPTFIRVNGNPDFEAEDFVGYEAGYRNLISSRFFVDLTVFNNHHDNLETFGTPSFVVETTPPPARTLLALSYANGARGTSSGFEVAPDWTPTTWAQVRGSYSYIDINLHNVPGNTDVSAIATYEGSTPRHQLQISSLLTLPGNLEIDPTVRYASALPARSVRAFSTLDLRFGWRAPRGLEVSVAAQNLLQPHHVEFAHDPPPPVALRRGVYASLVWRR